MASVFELIMLICFGLSWPISVVKSIHSQTTAGKSIVFIVAIIIGYISGIIGKIVNNNISYVLIFYCINLCVVTLDLVVYFINKHKENEGRNHYERFDQQKAAQL